MTRVSFHVPRRLLEDVDKLVKQGAYKTRSHAIRAAIALLIEQYRKAAEADELDGLLLHGRPVGPVGGGVVDMAAGGGRPLRRVAAVANGSCVKKLRDRYIRLLAERARSTRSRVFSVRPGHDTFVHFGVVCSQMRRFVLQALADCVVAVDRKYITLDAQCVARAGLPSSSLSTTTHASI